MPETNRTQPSRRAICGRFLWHGFLCTPAVPNGFIWLLLLTLMVGNSMQRVVEQGVTLLLAAVFFGRGASAVMRQCLAPFRFLDRRTLFHLAIGTVFVVWGLLYCVMQLTRTPASSFQNRAMRETDDDFWEFCRTDGYLRADEAGNRVTEEAWPAHWAAHVDTYAENVSRDYANHFGVRPAITDIIVDDGETRRIVRSRLNDRVVRAEYAHRVTVFMLMALFFLLGLTSNFAIDAARWRGRQGRGRRLRWLSYALHPLTLLPMFVVSFFLPFLDLGGGGTSAYGPLMARDIVARGGDLIPITLTGWIRVCIVEGVAIVLPVLCAGIVLLYVAGRNLFRYVDVGEWPLAGRPYRP